MTNAEPREYILTGGAGFVGSHLSEALLAQGAQVVAVDDLSTGTTRNIVHLMGEERFRFIQGDVTDETVLEDLASNASVVMHLASAVGVRLITDDPVGTIETNVLGARAVLRSAARTGCRVLLASTSEAYGKGESAPFGEGDDAVIGPSSKSRWSYAASKLVGEFLGMAYAQQYGLEVVPFRLFNTVGPRQTGRYGMVVPRFVRQALQGEPITVYGDGLQTRSFCDVRDVVRAIIGLAEHPDSPGYVYNVGSTDEITIRELAERIKQITRSDSEIVHVPYEEIYGLGFEDIRRRAPDLTRIHGLLGWRPTVPLEETLGAIVEHERSELLEAADPTRGDPGED